MRESLFWLFVCAAGAGAIAALFHRRERHRLRQRLEDAAGELQRLQNAFARFAPRTVEVSREGRARVLTDPSRALIRTPLRLIAR